MPVVGAATATENPHAGEGSPERKVTAAEIGRIAAVERLRLVQLGMALGRRIGPDAVNALNPRLAARKRALEMGRMRAVDQEVFASALRCVIDCLNRLAQGLSLTR